VYRVKNLFAIGRSVLCVSVQKYEKGRTTVILKVHLKGARWSITGTQCAPVAERGKSRSRLQHREEV